MMTACFSVEILSFLTKLHLREMEIISTQKFILLTLGTVAFLTPHGVCLDELMKSSLESREDADDKYYEIKDSILEEKQRSLNFEEMKDWGSKNFIKVNTPTINKVPNSVANLPLRFGRSNPEERSIKPSAYLPLRFGRAFGESLSRRAPSSSYRPGRSPLARSSIKSLLNLPQRFGKSVPISLSQGVQESEPGM
uniref:Neuropeptide VF n=1 Tax=Meleagris gallopavo TaxID=9103 RepID=G1NDU2_MELGA